MLTQTIAAENFKHVRDGLGKELKCRSNRPSNLDSWGNIFFEEINNPPSKANCQNKSPFDSKVSPSGTVATEK